MTDTRTTGEKIRAVRERRGLMQLDVASACEMDRANLAHIELGDRDIRISTLRRIAAVLGVRPRYLL